MSRKRCSTTASIRPAKKVAAAGSPKAQELVFCDALMISTSIAGFLDEWSNYNLSCVNKACSVAINKYHYPRDERDTTTDGRHYMAKYFDRKNICMVCLATCTSGDNCPSIGLYCHTQCVPSHSNYILGTGGSIPKAASGSPVPGDVITVLYDKAWPFIINHERTVHYHTRRDFSVFHSIYVDSACEKYLKDVASVIKTVDKSEAIDRAINKKRKVRLGGNMLSLYGAFCKQYPGHDTAWSVPNIKKMYDQMGSSIMSYHSEMVAYFSKHVRPKLFIKSANFTNTWGHFVRYCDADLYANKFTFHEWLIRRGFMYNPQRMKDFMSTSVHVYNTKELLRSTKQSVNEMNNLLQTSPSCLNIHQTSISAIVTSFISYGAHEIIHNTAPAKVFGEVTIHIINAIIKFTNTIMDIKKALIANTSTYTLSSLSEQKLSKAVNAALVNNPRLLFTIDHQKFHDRVIALSHKFPPIHVIIVGINQYDRVYTDAVEKTLSKGVTARIKYKRCSCSGSNAQDVCIGHGMCADCCDCGECYDYSTDSSDT